MKDEKNPEYMFQTIDAELLIKAATGEINAGILIKEELEARGIKIPKSKTDYEHVQIHAGLDQMNLDKQPNMNKLWHTDHEGNYWCGHWYNRTPRQLLEECRSTIIDLIVNHTDLI